MPGVQSQFRLPTSPNQDWARRVRSGSDLPDRKLFAFMVSIVFLMDRRPNCNFQIFLLDSIERQSCVRSRVAKLSVAEEEEDDDDD